MFFGYLDKMSILKIKNDDYNIRINNINFIKPIISHDGDKKEAFFIEFFYDFCELEREKTTEAFQNIFDYRGEIVEIKYDERNNVFCSEENRKKRFEINGEIIFFKCYKNMKTLVWTLQIQIKKIKKDSNEKMIRNFQEMNLNI